MDVVFLNPTFRKWFSRYSRTPCVTRGGTIYYPFMLAMGAGIAERKGFKVKLIDSIVDDLTREQEETLVTRENPRLIVVETSTPSFNSDLEISNKLKELNPKAKVILVGRHVSRGLEDDKNPTLDMIKKTKVDGILRGEFYNSVVKLLEGNELRKVEGATYLSGEKFIHNKDARQEDPNNFPFVSEIYKKFLNPKKYFYASLTNPYLLLQFGYGCPYSCAFCHEMYTSSYRSRSIEHFIKELKYIKKELPYIKELLLDDPTFVIDEEKTKQLCQEIIDNKIKLRWSCNSRCNITLETLKIMKKANGRLIHVGIESQNQQILDMINKNIQIDRETQFLHDARKAGIIIHGCFVLGLPGDNEQTLRQTLDYAKKVPLDSIQAFPLTPNPGTSTWKWAVKNDYLITNDFSQWLQKDGSYNCVISSEELSNKDILKWVEKYYKEFYYRSRYLLYKIGQSVTSLSEARRNLRAFKTMIS